uniref:Uncharacterized protein n=1 Tax=uncultured marine virus TaxID=186617 RepID=A0A0F7L625_9VIRU|nr:hypothetical protein [uncultured marine virus]
MVRARLRAIVGFPMTICRTPTNCWESSSINESSHLPSRTLRRSRCCWRMTSASLSPGRGGTSESEFAVAIVTRATLSNRLQFAMRYALAHPLPIRRTLPRVGVSRPPGP